MKTLFLFLLKYSPALVACHLFGTFSLQQPDKASTTASGPGDAKNGTLYRAAVISSSSSSSFNFDGCTTLCTLFFQRPLLHLMSKYPTLTTTFW